VLNWSVRMMKDQKNWQVGRAVVKKVLLSSSLGGGRIRAKMLSITTWRIQARESRARMGPSFKFSGSFCHFLTRNGTVASMLKVSSLIVEGKMTMTELQRYMILRRTMICDIFSESECGRI